MPDLERLLAWQIDETAGFDSAWVSLRGRRLSAEGRAIGLGPVPFWTTYRLETIDDFVTAQVVVESRWADGAASLHLSRNEHGWIVNGERRADQRPAGCALRSTPIGSAVGDLSGRGTSGSEGSRHCLE
jgi:hypothetical protein